MGWIFISIQALTLVLSPPETSIFDYVSIGIFEIIHADPAISHSTAGRGGERVKRKRKFLNPNKL